MRLPKKLPSTQSSLIIAAMLLPIVLLGWKLVVTEEPDYERVERRDGLELRRYAPFMVAETEVSARFATVQEAAFPRLVGYVKGNNATGRNVPMRAPVTQQPLAGEANDGTGDSTGDGTGDDEPADWRVQFVMPWEYLPSMLPRPADPAVRLQQMPARLVAARRYGGNWRETRYRAQEAELLAAIEREGLDAIGAPIFARYNAPFIPGFLRRNEVLVEVRDLAPDAPMTP